MPYGRLLRANPAAKSPGRLEAVRCERNHANANATIRGPMRLLGRRSHRTMPVPRNDHATNSERTTSAVGFSTWSLMAITTAISTPITIPATARPISARRNGFTRRLSRAAGEP
jgi:hypothetical protein